jgi:hypothetical protein
MRQLMRDRQLLHHRGLVGEQVQRPVVRIIEAAHVRRVQVEGLPLEIHLRLDQVHRFECCAEASQSILLPREHRFELAGCRGTGDDFHRRVLRCARVHHFGHAGQRLLYHRAQRPLIRRSDRRQSLEVLD